VAVFQPNHRCAQLFAPPSSTRRIASSEDARSCARLDIRGRRTCLRWFAESARHGGATRRRPQDPQTRPTSPSDQLRALIWFFSQMGGAHNCSHPLRPCVASRARGTRAAARDSGGKEVPARSAGLSACGSTRALRLRPCVHVAPACRETGMPRIDREPESMGRSAASKDVGSQLTFPSGRVGALVAVFQPNHRCAQLFAPRWLRKPTFPAGRRPALRGPAVSSGNRLTSAAPGRPLSQRHCPAGPLEKVRAEQFSDVTKTELINGPARHLARAASAWSVGPGSIHGPSILLESQPCGGASREHQDRSAIAIPKMRGSGDFAATLVNFVSVDEHDRSRHGQKRRRGHRRVSHQRHQSASERAKVALVERCRSQGCEPGDARDHYGGRGHRER
jgi:hypothetical protein